MIMKRRLSAIYKRYHLDPTAVTVHFRPLFPSLLPHKCAPSDFSLAALAFLCLRSFSCSWSPLCCFQKARSAKELMLPRSSPKPMTYGNWCINTPVNCPLGSGNSKACTLHWRPASPQWGWVPHIHNGSCLNNTFLPPVSVPLPPKETILETLSQGLLLREPKLRQVPTENTTKNTYKQTRDLTNFMHFFFFWGALLHHALMT